MNRRRRHALGDARPAASESPQPAGSHEHILYPLDVTYARSHTCGPRAAAVSVDQLPTRPAALLNHQANFTTTLEQYHHAEVVLRVLCCWTDGERHIRRVLLSDSGTRRPLAIAAMAVDVKAFCPRVRAAILRADIPFGRLMRDEGVEYVSRPVAYLKVVPNAEMMAVFGLPDAKPLYGRKTKLVRGGTAIGTVVEVLPPA